MILAAGLGTRLRPLTDTTPKPLLPLSGRPLIEWNLLLLRQYGITEVVINLHHLGDQIAKALGDGVRLGMRIAYSPEPLLLGTGGGIKQAEPFFGDDTFLVLNGDTMLDVNLLDLLDSHARGGGLATMVVRDDPDVERWGVVEVDDQRRVIRIGGRGLAEDRPAPTSEPESRIAAPARRMFAGVHVMHPRLIRDVPAGRPSSIIDAYVSAITDGELILGYSMEGYWSDIGTPERYRQAELDAASGRCPLAARGERSRG